MRKYAYLKEPLPYEGANRIYKIMLYETREGIYVFEYFSLEAVQCSADRWYDSLEELYAEWNDLLDERGWIELDDPLPGCQHDAFIPLRVKGRDVGKPEWGQLEVLQNGIWVTYKPV